MPSYAGNWTNMSREEILEDFFKKMNVNIKDNDLRAERKRKARLLTREAEYRNREQRLEAARREIELRPNTIIRKKNGRRK